VFPDRQIFNLCFLTGEFAKTNFKIQRFFKEDILSKERFKNHQQIPQLSPGRGASAGTIARVHRMSVFPCGGFSDYFDSKSDFQGSRFPDGARKEVPAPPPKKEGGCTCIFPVQFSSALLFVPSFLAPPLPQRGGSPECLHSSIPICIPQFQDPQDCAFYLPMGGFYIERSI